MGWLTGLEPATPGITIRCSNQLSYSHHKAEQFRESVLSCQSPFELRFTGKLIASGDGLIGPTGFLVQGFQGCGTASVASAGRKTESKPRAKITLPIEIMSECLETSLP